MTPFKYPELLDLEKEQTKRIKGDRQKGSNICGRYTKKFEGERVFIVVGEVENKVVIKRVK